MEQPTITKTDSQDSRSSDSLKKREPTDFEFGRVLGEGSYSTVLYAFEQSKKRPYAIKVLDKKHIVKEKKIKYVTIEKDVLYLLNHPYCVKLYYTFQDTLSLYFALEYCSNGDLLGFLKSKGRFTTELTKYYMSEILVAVDHIHSKGVIHRDLKPENILLDEDWHIKITDFGSAKIVPVSRSGDSESITIEEPKKSSFVGTAEYSPPELLNEQKASIASDIWALGCILYQLIVGVTPFKGSNEYQTFQKIVNLDYKIPINTPDVAKTLISKILVLDAKARPTLSEFKSDEFFSMLSEDWDQVVEIHSNPNSIPKMEGYLEPLYKHPLQLDLFDPNLHYDLENDNLDKTFQDLKIQSQISLNSPDDDMAAIHGDETDEGHSSESEPDIDDWSPSPTYFPDAVKFGLGKKVFVYFSNSLEVDFLFEAIWNCFNRTTSISREPCN
ncbi:kinase-like domain-containing protein [Globomyces pollinis-pini]|nr:kinase-like domain-containing protein [Globomyces pollinis-pini]